MNQITSLGRFYDDYRFIALYANAIALAAFGSRIVTVHMVELILYDLELRVIRQNLL